MPKYCESCGKETKKGAKFCHNCGHKLSSKVVKTAKKTEKVEKSGKWSKDTRIICGIVLVILVVSAFAGVAMMWMEMDEIMESPEFEEMLRLYNTSGTPVNQECNTTDDCACTNEDSTLCRPEIVKWSCIDGTCEMVDRYDK